MKNMSDLYAPSFDYPTEDKNTGEKLKTHIIDFIQSVVVIGAIFALIYLFVAQPHKVSGNSMVPTFHNNDYILTDKLTYRFRTPQRGDVIVLKNPRNENQDFIKRIIGLPGETISVKDSFVYINGLEMQELYLPTETLTSPGNFLREDEEIKVGPNQMVVFGDNRGASSDSREWGPITKEEIVGRVIFRYFPLDVFGLIRN